MALWHHFMATAAHGETLHSRPPMGTGTLVKTIQNPANLPPMLNRWISSVFHRDGHLAAIFTPSVGLERVIRQPEANFLQRALNNSLQSVSRVNAEMHHRWKATLQNQTALDIPTAAGGTLCPRCMYVPDNPGNISPALKGQSREYFSGVKGSASTDAGHLQS